MESVKMTKLRLPTIGKKTILRFGLAFLFIIISIIILAIAIVAGLTSEGVLLVITLPIAIGIIFMLFSVGIIIDSQLQKKIKTIDIHE